MATKPKNRSARQTVFDRDLQGHYRAMGVDPSATAEDIKIAFRERAKKLHPDQGGGKTDTDAFRRILESYEVLRDEHKRRAYDNLARAEAKQAQARQNTARRRSRRRALRIPLDMLRSPLLYVSVVLGLMVLGLFSMWRTSEESLREHKIVMQQMYQRLEAVAADAKAAEDRYRASLMGSLEPLSTVDDVADVMNGIDASDTDLSFGGGTVFEASIFFPQGRTELDGTVRHEAAAVLSDLEAAIDGVPADRQWLVLVEGNSPRAAADDSVAVTDWESTILRIGSILGYVVAQGVPQDRLAVRFQAGFDGLSADGVTDNREIELKLVCCLQ